MQERLLVQKIRVVKKERQLDRYIALSLQNYTEQETIPLKLKKNIFQEASSMLN